jgi:WXG100 family type VII secretion target
MTDMLVRPEVLAAHSAGTADQAENFRSLTRLLEQANMADECFGPLFFFFKDAYRNALGECQQQAERASSYLDEVSSTVTEVANSYAGTDEAGAGEMSAAEQELDDVGGGPGSLDDLNSAGDAKRKTDAEQITGYGSSWAATKKVATDAANPRDPGSPPEVFFATVNSRMELLNTMASPGGALVDNGLGFLIAWIISPLIELLEWALGDPEQMRSTAKGWDGVIKWLGGVAERERERADATADGWQGEAGDAFRAEMAEFADGAEAMAGDINDLKGVLETAAAVFDTFVQIIVDIIQEFVIGMIVEWLAALAASWITGGASLVTAEATTATWMGRVVIRIKKAINWVQQKLRKAMTELEEILQKLRSGGYGQFAKNATKLLQKVSGVPVIGKRTVGRNSAARLLTSYGEDGVTTAANKVIRDEVVGSEAVAQHVVRAGLGVVGLSGSAKVGQDVKNAAMENIPGAVVEWGAGYAYDKAGDPSTDEEREATQDEAFELNEDENPPQR